jgi:hypothetical protein
MRDKSTNPKNSGLTMQDINKSFGKIKADAAPMRWFRMYSEFATDPKVQMLSEADQRRYMMLLCLRCSNGDVTLQDAECAFQMRISESEYAATKAVLIARGLIDEANQPTAWDRRQYVSDTSNSRVSRHRERKRKDEKQTCNVTVTAPETDTEKETDTEVEVITPTQQEAAREGEVLVGHGVFVNCQTIRHKAFVISLPSLALNTGSRFPADELKAKAQAHALQWAAELEAGKRPDQVLPNKIANFLASTIMGEFNRQQCADVRKAKVDKNAGKPTVAEVIAKRMAAEATGAVQ